MNNRWKRAGAVWGLRLLRGVAAGLLAVAFLLTVLSYLLGEVLPRRDTFSRAAQQDALLQAMLEEAREELEAECLFYDLPYTVVEQSLTREMVADYMNDYADALYDGLFVSGTLEAPAVAAEPFYDPIAHQLPEVEPEILQELSQEFANVTASVWRLGVSQRLLSPLHRIMTHPFLKGVTRLGYLWAALTVVAAALCLLLDRRPLCRRVFAVAGTLTAGSMLVYVPLHLLYTYDLAERLVLGDSPLRLLVVGWFDTVTQQLDRIALWLLILTAALTVAAALWVVWPRRDTPPSAPAEEDDPAAQADATA